MTKIPVLLMSLALMSFTCLVHADGTVPEPFRDFDPNSKYTINYEDVTVLLRATVVNVGRSSRNQAAKQQAKTGTRLGGNHQSKTANEGNRFYFEAFEESPENRKILHDMRLSLAKVPDDAPLALFSRDEQLAYWLNLYNITLLDELVSIYPKRKLKKVLTGKRAILDEKLLNVAGVSLSLNDIQYTILKQNYDSNPLILYGLYQGIIGGPNIRRSAYTGENVYRLLVENAQEFVNSNRGTYPKSEREFQASSLYKRNEAFFTDFQTDLRKHLMRYLRDREQNDLVAAATIKPNINDWNITDLYGSKTRAGGSLADNPAALLGSFQSVTPTDGQIGGTYTTGLGAASSAIAANSLATQRIDPALLAHLRELNAKREATAVENSKVTIEEVETSN